MFLVALNGFCIETRDLLQQKVQEIDFNTSLISDLTELDFPDYGNGNFWNSIPGNMRNQNIKHAEEYLNYDWQVVKATDYLEMFRSEARNSEANAAIRASVITSQ